MSIICDSPGLMPIAEAMNRIYENIRPIETTEMVILDDAIGRVVARPVYSPIDVPAFDNSAMDGYAINTQNLNLEDSLNIIGKAFAGKPFPSSIGDGECVRIMTGGVIPKGADAVVMQENTIASEHTIHLTQLPKPAEAIRRAGSDISHGAVVVPGGKTLTPIDIGLLASLGERSVQVFRRLKVAVFSTGDELLDAGQPLRPGCIYDSNRPMLCAMLKSLHYDVIDLGKVNDNKDELRRVFALADSQADVIITTGGVSVGEADYTRIILEEIGEIGFWKIAMKPGKPLAFGRLPQSIFFGLPGNPVSAAATFMQIAKPTLARIAGNESEQSPSIPAVADSLFRKRPGRTDFQRAFYWVDNSGVLKVKPSGSQSSGVLSTFSNSNCFAILEQQRSNVEAGETVWIQPFN